MFTLRSLLDMHGLLEALAHVLLQRRNIGGACMYGPHAAHTVWQFIATNFQAIQFTYMQPLAAATCWSIPPL